MKLPAFDHFKMQWDAWNAFHVVHKYHALIQFDTGEFVVSTRRWPPDERRVYADLNIAIVSTDDDACPPLYSPDPPLYTPGMASKPIPKSHLNHKGQQVLLLDLDHKRAVSLDYWLTKNNAPLVPERFTDSRVSAYYAGPNAMPVTATPIVRHFPQPLTFNERAHIKELEEASKVWLQMQSDQDAITLLHRKLYEAKLKVADFVDVSFAMLTTEHRCALAVNGFDMVRKEEHPWLMF